MATLATIRAKVRQRADIEAETARYPDSELLAYINDSYDELYGLLVRHMPHLMSKTNQEIAADGSATYTLPSDHYSTVAVFEEESEHYRTLHHDTMHERPFGRNAPTGVATRYRIQGTAIELYPKPSSGTYIHVYIPRPTALAADADTLDDVLGWDEFVVVDAAIKCLLKENSDIRPLAVERERLVARIEAEAEARLLTEAWTVHDKRGLLDPLDPWYDDPSRYRWYTSGE